MSKFQTNKTIYQLKKEKGFSLLEVITVLFIISLGLVGILALIVQNVQTETANRNKLIASQLAQEGLELARNMRGDNWLQGRGWSKGLNDNDCGGCPNYTMDYAMDYTGKKIEVNNIDEAVLQVNGEGYYVHDNTLEDSKFKRMITVDSSSVSSSSVSCKVKWKAHDRTHTYTADTVLYNWR